MTKQCKEESRRSRGCGERKTERKRIPYCLTLHGCLQTDMPGKIDNTEIVRTLRDAVMRCRTSHVVWSETSSELAEVGQAERKK